jgi:hypothetical protein
MSSLAVSRTAVRETASGGSWTFAAWYEKITRDARPRSFDVQEYIPSTCSTNFTRKTCEKLNRWQHG